MFKLFTPPLYPHNSFYFFKKENKNDIIFFNSGRSGLFLIVQTLKEMYENTIFLIPTYNCYSVVSTLENANVNYDFVEIGENLDFDLNDLEFMLNKYSSKKVVLIATSLFGIKLRDYKSIYKDLIVIEDLAQSTFNTKTNADFQFVSFGKGKMISAWSGGGVISNSNLLKEKYSKLEIEDSFIKSYILSNVQKIISKYFWFLIEYSPLNPEKKISLEIINNNISKLSPSKINWILNSIENLSLKNRIKISNYYLNNISKEFLFDLELNIPYLRVPVKKIIKNSGVSFLRTYEATYNIAKEKRKRDFDMPQRLLYNSSFLPTHNLIDLKYAKKVVGLVNE